MPRPLDAKPKPYTPPEPAALAAPPRDITADANKSIAAHAHHSVLEPIRTAAKFISGTIHDTINGMAHYGRKGFKVGLGLGVIAAIATGGLSALFGVAAVGLGVGMAGGIVKGVLTGGMHAVGRDYRARKYADDLVQRKTVRENAPANTYDYRAIYRQQQLDNSYKTQQLLARVNENTRDFNTYWQDREKGRHERLPQERGLGF